MRVVSLVLAAVCACLPVAEAAELKLRILATTDIHMNLVDYDFIRDQPDETIGLNRAAAVIAEARAENPNAILVDAGDLLQGSPMGDVVARIRPLQDGEVHPAYDVMNRLGYDVAAAGNHEFNFGLDFLERAQQSRNFPLLAANVYRANPDGSPGETLFPASIVLERKFKDDAGTEQAIKIGVIGVLPPQITNWDKDKLAGRIVTGDVVEAVEREIPVLKAQGAAMILVISHGGLNAQPRTGMDENASAYIAALNGVDAVVTGHSHRVFPGKDYDSLTGADTMRGTVDGKPVVMAGSFGSHVGVIDMVLSDESGAWRVKDGTGSVRPIASEQKGKARLAADAAITALLKPWIDATLDYVRAPIGEAKQPINTYLTLLGDTGALRLVAEAQAEAARALIKGTPYESLPLLSAAAPFRVGGRPGPDYYTDIKAGPVAIKDAADLYIYPNMLTIVKLTGREVHEYLEKSARLFNQIDPANTAPQDLIGNMPAYNFDILYGLTYAIDVTKPARYGRGPAIENPNTHRVTDILYQGQPLDDAKEYLIVTNNYRANGGGEFPRMDGSAIVAVGEMANRDVLIEHVRAKKEITLDTTPVWRFVPLAGAPDIRIEIGPKGAEAAATDKRLTKVGASESGFDVYKVNLGE